MKKKIISAIGVVLLLAGGLTMLSFRHQSPKEPAWLELVAQARAANAVGIALDFTNWPNDPRPEVKEFYQFARIAKLYRFDPHVIYFRKEPAYHSTIVETRTHATQISFRGNRISHVLSFVEDSHAGSPDADAVADAKKQWVNCVGTWNEQEMINETLNILQRLGYTNLLSAVQKHDFKVQEFTWLGLDGQSHTNYPFATVTLSKADSLLPLVIAEYRMGTNGRLAGLTHWRAQ